MMIDILFIAGVIIVPILALMARTMPDIQITRAGLKLLGSPRPRDRWQTYGLLAYFGIWMLIYSLIWLNLYEQLPGVLFYLAGWGVYGWVSYQMSPWMD